MPLAVLGFLISVAWLPIPSAISTPRWMLVEVGCAALLLVALWNRPLLETKGHRIVFAVLAWSTLTVAWSFDRESSLGALFQVAGLVLSFCVGAASLTLRPFWLALGAGATINAVIAIAQTFGWRAFDVANLSPGVPIGTFGNKNFLAFFGAIALVGLLTMPRPSRWHVAMLPGAAIATLLPTSRGAMVAAIAAVASVLWTKRGGRLWTLASIAAVPAALILALDLWVTPGRFSSSATPRLEMWDWTVSNWKFFGWGVGSYGSVFPFEHASSDLLEFVFEIGAGAALLAWLLTHVLRPSTLHAERAVVVCVVVESLFAFPLHMAAPAFVAAVCAGRIARDLDDHRLVQPGGGDRRKPRLPGLWPLPFGAPRPAGPGGEAVPVRSQHPDRRGEVQAGGRGA